MNVDALINAGIIVSVVLLIVACIVLFVQRCNGDENAD